MSERTNKPLPRKVDALVRIEEFKTNYILCLADCSKREICGFAQPPYSATSIFEPTGKFDGCINFTENYVSR